jgi:hypothetical protein
VLAEDVIKRTGKRTRIYLTDRGGYDPIRPYVDLGIIEVVELGPTPVLLFMHKASRGFIRDSMGKWVLDKDANSKIGMYAFESAHSMAKCIQLDMNDKASKGIVMGGDANTSFDVQGDGETVRMGSTKGYGKFSIPQERVYAEILESQRLDAEFVVWTAGVSKEEDDVSTTKIIGPDVIGKALTGVLSMEFSYTIRLDVLPAKDGKPERHLLYLGTTADVNAGNATALGNIRRPLDAPPLTTTVVEPANIVQALKMVRDDAAKAATDTIRKRITAAGVKL